MDICLAGDCNFISEVYEIEPENIVVDKEIWHAEKKYINLEQAISENNVNTDKYMMYSGRECIPYLKALGITGVSLANNHIHDKGLSGINDTIHYLEQEGIEHAGAGENLEEAKHYFQIDDNLYFIAFCDYGKDYIRDVKCANEKEAGVNPYSMENVLAQLDSLPENSGAIIYIHWSIEYSWLVPYDCIYAAEKILSHPKTKLLIGQHAHIPLGWLEKEGKYAFFSLGNFLFSNFYLCPPHEVKSSANDIEKGRHRTARIMCAVNQKTYKKWYFTNRVSIIVNYNTKNNITKIDYSYQKDNKPYVCKLKGWRRDIFNRWLHLLSGIYKIPKPIYICLFKVNLILLYGCRKVKRGMVNHFYGKK